MTHNPVHVEVGVPDPAAAIAFYSELFGWEVQSLPGGGMATAGPLTIGFHGGDPAAIHEVFYDVADLTDAMAELTRLGGTLTSPVQESPGFGTWVECGDPQGARFGLVQRPE